ncbi:MAG: Fic family protein [Candidatus Scalindua sp. AMX11]|nr:MAG: Fic family protein [Candidatus Scalindua sp.]NOG84626.1 Fic family protein [Planctomycetota bacterium]RZV92399.1 MAG: Fic family protein [Candidatus Scalindua sp. SCAELEC01]TDE66075.1 MAG: Fic family protein [Candidatus Scalindua sp. AMX11]GJQ59047.1 MAG: cell division protein Fic [Candidatus Scalindua sp.]
MDFEKLDQLKQRLDSFRPLPVEIMRNLHDDLVLRWTYNSNAIEGNTLTLKETRVVLEGITIGGKTLREHLEVINHRETILYVEELARQKEALSEWQIKSLHQLILKKIDDANAGRYRTINVTISGATHRPPDHFRLAEEMAGFISWYKTKGRDLHPVERAALVHADFVKIHPFVDGNGRTSRLLMNLELMKSGFPPAVLPVEKRLAYYEALDTAHTRENYEPFLALIFEVVEQSFEPYWFALGEKA